MELFYSVLEIARIIGKDIYKTASALKADGVTPTHNGMPANLKGWTGGISWQGNNVYVNSSYYDKPDPSEVLVLTEHLPASWVKKIKSHEAEIDGIAAGGVATGAVRQEGRTRTDGLKTAMLAGVISYKNKHHLAPTARALFDWIASNDETGNVVDFNQNTDTITWKRADGGLSDTTFKSFQGRFTNLEK